MIPKRFATHHPRTFLIRRIRCKWANVGSEIVESCV